MMGSFESFKIINVYVNLLISEPYTAGLLMPVVQNYENEANILEKLDIQNFSLDMTKPEGLTQIPIFKEQYQHWQEQINNKKEIDLRKGLPIYFAMLSGVAFMIEEIKNLHQAGDSDGANKLIEEVKEKSMSVADSSVVIGVETKRMTYGQFLDVSMEQINKYIIDEIDSQALLENNSPKAPIFFDEEKDILYIHGEPIRIKLKNAEPYDHYILVALSKNDFNDKAFYSEITYEYFSGEKNKHRGLYSACERLNKKIAKQTNNTILEFIEYTSGKVGSCQVNQKYL